MLIICLNLSFKSIFFHYKQAFFEDLWNWLIYGNLDEIDNKFFIICSNDKEEIFKFREENDLPDLDENLLKRILMHGKLIYLFDINYQISWKELFSSSLDELSAEFKELCTNVKYCEIQLVKFIKNTTGILLKVIDLILS